MGFELNPLQEATISPEAAAWLRAANPLPDNATGDPILFRSHFQSLEDVAEGNLIKRYNLKVEQKSFGGITTLAIEPPSIEPRKESKIIYNIHGGGCVMGTARDRAALYTAGEFGIRVYSVEYSLSPEVKYPVAIDQCLTVYKELIKEFGASNIIVSSSSAGGQLAGCLFRHIHIEKLAAPLGSVFFTPTLDLSAAGDSSVVNDGRDLVPTSMFIESFRTFYLGGADPKDPAVSPIYFGFDNTFPPTIITTGTRDMMLSHAIRLDWKLRSVGVRTSLLVGEGMWHGFNWEADMPEAVACRKEVYRFLETLI
ncbi:Alpha/Beta hydrolase protein [Xylogone sp. PMI_703]|nr:Alpha/Beta hydrolase protein [Xylogone sp. PMI_703]